MVFLNSPAVLETNTFPELSMPNASLLLLDVPAVSGVAAPVALQTTALSGSVKPLPVAVPLTWP